MIAKDYKGKKKEEIWGSPAPKEVKSKSPVKKQVEEKEEKKSSKWWKHTF